MTTPLNAVPVPVQAPLAMQDEFAVSDILAHCTSLHEHLLSLHPQR